MWDLNSYHKLIDTLGVVGTLTYTKPPHDSVANIKMGFAAVSKENESLINSLGAAAKIITIKKHDVTRDPVRYDTVMVGTEKYTIDSVNPVHLPGTAQVVGFRCFSKGMQT